MSRLKRREILILTLCLLLGFALRFYGFDRKSLWIDEVHTFNDSRDGLRGQLSYYQENPTYLTPPPVLYSHPRLLSIFQTGTGPSHHSFDLRNLVHTDDLCSIQDLLSCNCSSMHSFVDLHDLSHLFFPGWANVFVADVCVDGLSLFLYEASWDVEEELLDSRRIWFRYPVS